MAITKLIADSITSGAIANTPAFHASLSADQTGTDNTFTKLQINSEELDTDNCYDNSTNYRFTPTTAGKYYVYGQVVAGQNNIYSINCAIYKNGSIYANCRDNVYSNTRAEGNANVSAIIDFNGSSDYVELFSLVDITTGSPKYLGESGIFTYGEMTYFGAYRIIE
tara:strand:+ start:585 stop:1082 length:498 start_codon:yes stop_codon:yes gene_type:complete